MKALISKLERPNLSELCNWRDSIYHSSLALRKRGVFGYNAPVREAEIETEKNIDGEIGIKIDGRIVYDTYIYICRLDSKPHGHEYYIPTDNIFLANLLNNKLFDMESRRKVYLNNK